MRKTSISEGGKMNLVPATGEKLKERGRIRAIVPVDEEKAGGRVPSIFQTANPTLTV